MRQDNSSQWKLKVQELFQVCQDEFKRTTEIGKKMLNATKANTTLRESYEELGRLVTEAVKTGTLSLEDPTAKDLINTIITCQQNLEEMENEMNKIKFAAGPVDVSNKFNQKSKT